MLLYIPDAAEALQPRRSALLWEVNGMTQDDAKKLKDAIENGYYQRDDHPPFALMAWDDRTRYKEYVFRVIDSLTEGEPQADKEYMFPKVGDQVLVPEGLFAWLVKNCYEDNEFCANCGEWEPFCKKAREEVQALAELPVRRESEEVCQDDGPILLGFAPEDRVIRRQTIDAEAQDAQGEGTGGGS